ncbi:MAG: hypothetical protein EOP64_06065 [Sphingomonas sp.]|nr:MAG: hypothetical protein EOP64_06065 [Sphingomonas sp.]
MLNRDVDEYVPVFKGFMANLDRSAERAAPHRHLRTVGETLSRAFLPDESPNFDDLLAAIDEADARHAQGKQA